MTDWLNIPGAVKAITRLVESVGDAASAGVRIGTAKLEQVESGIRDQTVAKSKVSAAIAKSAAKAVGTDPDIGRRMIEKLASDQIRGQENREAIREKTIEHLSEAPVPPDTEGPSDDWMNLFERHAADASSERLRETWARILAGEIRKPGSFSLRTLSFISVLDKPLADTVMSVSGAVINGRMIPTTGPFHRGPRYSELLRLAEVGFVTMGSSHFFTMPAHGILTLKAGKSHTIFLRGAPGREINLPVAFLTRVATELLGVIDAPIDPATVNEIAKAISERNKLEAALVGPGQPVPEPFLSALRSFATNRTAT